MGTTSRGFPWPEPGSPADGPGAFQALAQSVNDEFDGLDIGGYSQGTLADRPAAGQAGRIYRVSLGTGLDRVYVDTGSAWVEIGTRVATGTLAARPTTFTGNRLYVVTGDSTSSNNGLMFFDTGTAWQQVGGPAPLGSAPVAASAAGTLGFDGIQVYVKTAAAGTAGNRLVGPGLEVMTTAQITALSGPSNLFTGRQILNSDTGQILVVKTSGTAPVVSGAVSKAQGSFTGNGGAQTIAVGFAPDLVIAQTTNTGTNAGQAILHKTDATVRQASYGSTGAPFAGDYLTSNGFYAGGAMVTNATTWSWTAFKFV